jgi:hypothetical protein
MVTNASNDLTFDSVEPPSLVGLEVFLLRSELQVQIFF